MAPTRQVQTHEAIVGLQQRRERSKVGGGPTVGLHVYPPLVRRQAKELQGPGFAQKLQLVHVLVAPVVPRPWSPCMGDRK